MENQQVLEALERLEDRIIELIARQAEHNTLLRQHEDRSLALQRSVEIMDQRIKPVEQHVKFINLSLKLAGTVFAGFCVQALVNYFL